MTAASPPPTPTSPLAGAGPKDPLLTGDAQLPLTRSDPPLIKAFKDALQTIINITDEWILYPDTRLYMIWQVFVMGSSIVLAVLVPYVVAFSVDVSMAIIFIYVAWCFQLLDMAASFRTAFVNEEGQMVDDKHTLAMQYIKGGRFFLDLLANMPLNWFSSDPVMARLLLSNRILSLNKALYWIRREEMKLTGSLLVQGYKFVLILALVVHYYACIWWLIGLPVEGSSNPEDLTWSQYDKDRINSVNLHTPEMKKNQSIQYIYSAYWVINLVTVPGFADLEAPTFKEKLIGLVMFLSALILFGWVTASVTSILANRDSQRSRYQQKLLSVRQYMDHNKFDTATRKRVSNYYDYLWKRNKGIDAKTIFNDLPTTFQAELALGINGHIISKVPLFQDTEIGFMRMLSLALQPVLFLPNEYVVKKGDIGSEMFFLHAGRVDVVSEDGKQVFATMQEGSFFGEIALFLSRPRTASIRAATYTDIYVLSKQNLDEVLAFYPAVRERIMAAAQERLRENLSRQQNTAVAPPQPTAALPASGADPNQPAQQTQKTPDTAAATSENSPVSSGANDSSGPTASDAKSSGTLPSTGDVSGSNNTSPAMPRADRSASNNHLAAKGQGANISMNLRGSNAAVFQRFSAVQNARVSSSVSIGPLPLAASGRPQSSNLGLTIPNQGSASAGGSKAASRNQLLGSILDMGGVVDEENSELVLPDSLFGMKIVGMSKTEIGKRESSDVLAIKSSTMALDESSGSVGLGPIGSMLKPGGGSGSYAPGSQMANSPSSQLRSSNSNTGSFIGRPNNNVTRRSSMFPGSKPTGSNSSIGVGGGAAGGSAHSPASQANRRRSLQVANSGQFMQHSGSSSPVSQVMSRTNTSGNAGSQGLMNRASTNRSSERVSETPGTNDVASVAGPPSSKPSPSGSRKMSLMFVTPAPDGPPTPPGAASRRIFQANDILAGTAFHNAPPIEDASEGTSSNSSAEKSPNGP